MNCALSHVRRHHAAVSIIDGCLQAVQRGGAPLTSSLLDEGCLWCVAFMCFPHTLHGPRAHNGEIAGRSPSSHPPCTASLPGIM